jgi:hypothetical protein
MLQQRRRLGGGLGTTPGKMDDKMALVLALVVALVAPIVRLTLQGLQGSLLWPRQVTSLALQGPPGCTST